MAEMVSPCVICTEPLLIVKPSFSMNPCACQMSANSSCPGLATMPRIPQWLPLSGPLTATSRWTKSWRVLRPVTTAMMPRSQSMEGMMPIAAKTTTMSLTTWTSGFEPQLHISRTSVYSMRTRRRAGKDFGLWSHSFQHGACGYGVFGRVSIASGIIPISLPAVCRLLYDFSSCSLKTRYLSLLIPLPLHVIHINSAV
jgi:hypothetical protein